MKSKSKQIINVAIDVLFIVTILLSNLFVGTPIRNNIRIVHLFINILALIYVIKDIKNRKNWKLNSIDICVIIIALSTFIPLLSNSYLRLRDTIEYIYRYMSVLNIYFITSKYIENKLFKISIITNTIIIISIITIIFGIDMMTQNIFQKVYSFLKVVTIYDETTTRMLSLFKYPNVFCIFLCSTLFLTLGSFLQEKRKYIKSIFGCCITMQFFAIIMTYSRLGWILLFIMILIYFMVLKKHRKEILKTILLCGTFTFIYFLAFNFFRSRGQTVLIWLSLFILMLIQFGIGIWFNKLKFNRKIIIISAVSLLIILGIIFCIMPSNLTLFNKENASRYYRRQNIKVNPSQTYKLTVDLISQANTIDNFKITIKELDSNEKEIIRHSVEFGSYSGTKEINFTTNEQTTTVVVTFGAKEANKETKLEIKNVFLNDREIKVYYKFIPIELINRIEKIKFDTASVSTRFSYIKCSIDLIKDNWIFGLGGYAWNNIDKDLELESVGEHCYPLQLFMQNGIIAFLAYLILITVLLIKIFKFIHHKCDNLIITSLCFSLFIIILHSFFDFDMYFMSILLITYMYISILNTYIKNAKNYEKNNHINFGVLKYLYIIILLIFLRGNVGEIIANNIDTDNINDYPKKAETIDLKINLCPYNYSYYYDKVTCLITMKNKGIYQGNSTEFLNASYEIIDKIDFIINSEKYNDDEYLYSKKIKCKIDLINDKNKTEMLDDIRNIWINDIGSDNEIIYSSMIKGLSDKLTHEELENFIISL